jgi:membrane-associated phospholipid phosphatase
MGLISQLGDKAGVFTWFVIAFQFQNGAHGFFLACQMSIFPMISQTMKSIIREPRPFFVDSSIKVSVSNCKHMEFGNPSSHTFGASFLLTTLVWSLLRHYTARLGVKPPRRVEVAAYSILAIVLALIGFSRVFKGVHTYNQVLSGTV